VSYECYRVGLGAKCGLGTSSHIEISLKKEVTKFRQTGIGCSDDSPHPGSASSHGNI
jgi:hypothetical protein